jgi:hypothetical protein
MIEAFPAVPLGANLSVGAAILSYDGALTVSLTADADACPDLDVLAAGIGRGFRELGAEGRPVDRLAAAAGAVAGAVAS